MGNSGICFFLSPLRGRELERGGDCIQVASCIPSPSPLPPLPSKGEGKLKKFFVFISYFSKGRLRVIFQFLLLPPITEALLYVVSPIYKIRELKKFFLLFISPFSKGRHRGICFYFFPLSTTWERGKERGTIAIFNFIPL